MQITSRRTFLRAGAFSATALALELRAPMLHADPLGLPIGLQLYSVRDKLPKDFSGTLHAVAALGYREVEAAGFFGHTATEVKTMMTAAGLQCSSAHYPLAELLKDVDGTIAYAHSLGLDYVICSSPSFADTSRAAGHTMTVDDWKWNADQFNQIGRRLEAHGVHFGYHNHVTEFRDLNGTNGMETLLKNTDPSAVCLEMDCGWVVAAGKDPVDYLTQYHDRISMLHVKDLKPAAETSKPDARISTELGHGTIDYRHIFQAAKHAKIRHYFVEQEEFDGPELQELKVGYDYLHGMGA
jgi:sugar phosphate isomerase/epimerase